MSAKVTMGPAPALPSLEREQVQPRPPAWASGRLLGGRRLFGRLFRRRGNSSRREFNYNRIGTQSRWFTRGLDRLKSFCFRLVATERESN